MSGVKFAISYTVKNEARLLPDAIAYHREMGCSQFYVFWDGTSDNAPDLIAGMPDVSCRETFKVDELKDPPAWIAEIVHKWEHDMDVRKRINTYYATKMAREAGIDWLISIDPDELLYVNDKDKLDNSYFTSLLKTIAPEIDQILFRNLESIPSKIKSQQPFCENTMFLNRFPFTETVWRYSRALLGRLSRSPKAVALYDYFFYYVRFFGALPRKFKNPATGETIYAGYFLGYSSYKSAIRTTRSEEFNFCTHCWLKFRRRPRNFFAGNVLHFDLLDAQYFINKFRQRQQGIILPIFHLRYTLANVARNLSDEQVYAFFRKSFILEDPKIVGRLKKKNIVREVHIASTFFKKRNAARAVEQA